MLLISFSYTTADDNQAWIPANGDTDSGVGLGFLEFDFGHIFKGREEASTTTTTTTTTLAPAGGGGGVSKYDENIIFVDYPFGRPIYVEGMEGVFIKKKIKFFNLRDEELKLNYNFLGVNCVLNKTFDTIEAHSTTEVEMLCLTENADDIDMFTVKDSLGVDYERQVRFKRDTIFTFLKKIFTNYITYILFTILFVSSVIYIKIKNKRVKHKTNNNKTEVS